MKLRYVLLLLIAFALIKPIFALTFKVTVHNPNSYDLTNYQVRIDLSNYLSSATNLKVTDANGNLINFCYEQSNGECNTNPTKVIWVKVPSIPANGDAVVYITPSATNYATSGSNVFDLYDDFESYTANTQINGTNGWYFLVYGNSPYVGDFVVSTTEAYQGTKSLFAGGNSGLMCKDINLATNKFVLNFKMYYANPGNVLGIIVKDSNGNWAGAGVNVPDSVTQNPVYATGSDVWSSFGTAVSTGSWFNVEVKFNSNSYVAINIAGQTTSATLSYSLSDVKTLCVVDRGAGAEAYFDLIILRKYADQEPTITITPIDVLSITITNKKSEGFTSNVNVTVKVSNSDLNSITTTIYYLLDGNKVYSKQVTISANSYITDSYTYNILKAGSHNITVKVYDPTINKNISDSFIINLDLYDFSYADSKTKYYTSQISKSFNLRCGVLNHNVIVEMYIDGNIVANKTYTCDNSTFTDSLSTEVLKAGSHTLYLKLLAVDPSDNQQLATQNITVDLYDFAYADSKTKYYTSTVNKSFTLRCGALGHTVTVEMYVNGTKVAYKSYTCDNSTLTDSLSAEILKEGYYDLYFKLITVDSSNIQQLTPQTINLDLYNINVQYSNYTEYNSNKYVDTLHYTIGVRCGALGHNITIDAWNGRNYTVQCDNSTKTIEDSYRFLTEGTKQIWFYLNAIDSSDSRYFGNDTFIADLEPPIIDFTNKKIIDISPAYCIMGICKDLLGHVSNYTTNVTEYIINNSEDDDLFGLFVASTRPIAVNLYNIYPMFDTVRVVLNGNNLGYSDGKLYVNNTFALIYINPNSTYNYTSSFTPDVTETVTYYDLVPVANNYTVWGINIGTPYIESGFIFRVASKEEIKNLSVNSPIDVYTKAKLEVKDYKSLSILKTYEVSLGETNLIDINITNYPVTKKALGFLKTKYALAFGEPTIQMLLPTLDDVKVLRTYVTPAGYWVYLFRNIGGKYELVDVKKSEPTETGELDWFTVDADYLRFEFYNENADLIYYYEDLVSGNDYMFNLENRTTQTYSLFSNLNFTAIPDRIVNWTAEFNNTLYFKFNYPVDHVDIYYVTNNTVYKTSVDFPEGTYEFTLNLSELGININETIRMEVVVVFKDGWKASFYYFNWKKVIGTIEQKLSGLLKNLLLFLSFLMFFKMLSAITVIKWKSEYSHIVIIAIIPIILAYLGGLPMFEAFTMSFVFTLAGIGMVKYGV